MAQPFIPWSLLSLAAAAFPIVSAWKLARRRAGLAAGDGTREIGLTGAYQGDLLEPVAVILVHSQGLGGCGSGKVDFSGGFGTRRSHRGKALQGKIRIKSLTFGAKSGDSKTGPSFGAKMNRTALNRIETELKIRLPREYCDLVLARAHELKQATYKIRDDTHSWFVDRLYLDPSLVIGENLTQRESGSALYHAHPFWWESYFIFGCIGSGGYLALRLDGSPDVWFLSCETGEVCKKFNSLTDYVDNALEDYRNEPAWAPPPPTPNFFEAFTPEERDAYLSTRYRVPDPEKPYVAKIMASLDEDGPRLEYADWLEAHGQTARAKLIRARLVLDRKAQDFNTYPDALEQVQEAEAPFARTKTELPPGFLLRGEMERGMPSYVCISDLESNDEKLAATRFITRLEELMRTTPIRGIDMKWLLPNYAERIFNSDGGRQLTRLTFASRPKENELCPVIRGLVSSPLARTLRHLEIKDGLNYDINVDALANASLDSLEWLQVPFVRCSANALLRLIQAPWFRNLHRLLIGIGGEGLSLENQKYFGTQGRNVSFVFELLPAMPNLHTLALWFPGVEVISALGRKSDFRALRRLFIHGADLRGESAKSLAKIQASLVDFQLQNSSIKQDDVRTLLSSPAFAHVQVLTFARTTPVEELVDLIADSRCGSHLRILRLRNPGLRSLACTAFTRPGAFPKLTTLELCFPFAEDDPYGEKRVEFFDTAQFLQECTLASLKHFTLQGCPFDDACADIVATKRNFGGLTRFKLDSNMSPAAAERLILSPNLRNLIEFVVDAQPYPGMPALPENNYDDPAAHERSFHNYVRLHTIAKVFPRLADTSIMPKLVKCWISGTGVAKDEADAFTKQRPALYFS